MNYYLLAFIQYSFVFPTLKECSLINSLVYYSIVRMFHYKFFSLLCFFDWFVFGGYSNDKQNNAENNEWEAIFAYLKDTLG